MATRMIAAAVSKVVSNRKTVAKSQRKVAKVIKSNLKIHALAVTRLKCSIHSSHIKEKKGR